MSVPYVSSKALWIGFDNIRSVTLKVKFFLIMIRSIFFALVLKNKHQNLDEICKRKWLRWCDYLVT